jgi:Kef-type K+ transport system membrane component KefB
MTWLLSDPLTRFIAQVAVVLMTARLLGLLARRIGQPSVVAEIVAGIVLGPSVLGWISPAVAEGLFPVASLEPLHLASQLGLILFVFLIGLELDPALLRGQLRTSLVVGVSCIAVPFALGSGLAMFLGGFAGPDGVTLTFAAFIGAAMSVTAFPVLARLLAEHRLLRTRIGALAIACAAIDDAVAWCVLAFVAAFARADGVEAALVTTGLSAAFVLGMIVIVRPLLVRLVERSNAPLVVTHDTLAAVVIAVLVSAWITEQIGIHLVFGAFVLGAVIPKRDGFARAIAEKLEDVVVVVLLPLFFAVSGLRTQIDVIASADQIVACIAVVAVACAGKIGGGVLGGRLCGLPWREAGALGVLLNTRGLIQLIAINIGYELGVISSPVFSMMVVMVIVTTVATSPILRRIYPPRDALREIVTPKLPVRPRGYRIMACISHDRAGPPLVALASSLSAPQGETIALHLGRIDERNAARGEPPDPSGALQSALAHAERIGLPARPLAFESADIADDIVRVADLREVDLLLLGAHKPLAGQDALGGVLQDVLGAASGAVAIHVDRGAAMPPARAAVLYQGARHDRHALELAARLQAGCGAAVRVLATHPADVPLPEGLTADVLAVESFASLHEPLRGCDLVLLGCEADAEIERLLRDSEVSLVIVRAPTGALACARIAED